MAPKSNENQPSKEFFKGLLDILPIVQITLDLLAVDDHLQGVPLIGWCGDIADSLNRRVPSPLHHEEDQVDFQGVGAN